LDHMPTRVLLKRPENHDPRFRILLDALFDQVCSCLPALRKDPVARLESAILITSAAATTPFHFDPEVGFFSQIEGRKTYHLYAPDALEEQELERFYTRSQVDIGQVDINKRQASREYVFELQPGAGLHQPRNSPHWVQTHAERSVSYTMVFETEASRVQARARGFNHYLRTIGFNPAAPGADATRDAVKSRMLLAMQPVRQAAYRARHIFG
jgi:Cupin superfamily protein